MRSWYRLGLPPRACFILLLVLVLAVDLTAVAIRLCFGFWLETEVLLVSYGPFLTLAAVFCLLMSAVLGGYRVSRYPAPGSQYEAMLAQSPWKAGKRLPFGPWQPVSLDVVPFAGLVAVALGQWLLFRILVWNDLSQVRPGSALAFLFSGFGVCFIPAVLGLVFFGSWLAGAYRMLWGGWNEAILWPLLVVGAIVKASMSGAGFVAVTVFVVGVVVGAMLVVRRMRYLLVMLPERTLKSESSIAKVQVAPEIHFLAPRVPTQESTDLVNQSRPRALLIAAVVAVWYSAFPDGTERYWAAVAVIAMLGLFRTLAYIGEIQSHLGLAARWGTRKWIVPQYDRCWSPFFWMMCAALCGVLFAMMVSESIAGEVCALTVGVAVFIGLGSAADFERWSLTAPCAFRLRRNAGQRS